MKFPLPDHPFRAVGLSPTQCADYERVTDALLHETLLEYERFVHVENRTLDKKLWKPVKTRENLTVFKETQRARARLSAPHVSADTRATIATDMHEWKLPKLLAVGSIVGSLDDVMYGVVAPDVKSMLLRSSYVNDELVDGGVLFHIKSAVEEDPFRFLGIKWLVKAHPTAINALVSPRDTVVIDATGIHVQENGDHVGYHTFHSLLLPECPELKQHSILRGLISSCYLFKQMPNGTVEVYMKTYVEPGGRLSESLSTMSVANALIGCYKSVLCAQGKKLTWLIKHNSQERAKHRKRRGADSHECELCHASFRAYKSARGCQSCLRLVCSRCQVSRKISHMQRGLQVKQTSVVVCKDCVTNAAQLSAFDVARDEFVGKQTAQHSLMTDTHSTGDDAWTMSGITLLDEEALASTSPTTSESGAAEVGHHARTVSLDHDLQLYSSGSVSLDSPTKSVEYTSSIPTPTTMDGGLSQHQQQLLLQMNQLRIAAEQTYLITKQNESAMRFDRLD